MIQKIGPLVNNCEMGSCPERCDNFIADTRFFPEKLDFDSKRIELVTSPLRSIGNIASIRRVLVDGWYKDSI